MQNRFEGDFGHGTVFEFDNGTPLSQALGFEAKDFQSLKGVRSGGMPLAHATGKAPENERAAQKRPNGKDTARLEPLTPVAVCDNNPNIRV